MKTLDFNKNLLKVKYDFKKDLLIIDRLLNEILSEENKAEFIYKTDTLEYLFGFILDELNPRQKKLYQLKDGTVFSKGVIPTKVNKKYSFPVNEVYDWHNSHLAKPYIKERGYFGNSLDELETAVLNGENISCVTLNKIEEDVLCFQIGSDWMDYYESGSYGLFIPLKEVEVYQKLKEDIRD